MAIPGVDVGEVLGAGTFGTVHRGRHRFLGIDVAVKFIDPSPLGAAGPGQLLQEAQLMARLDHPNLLRVFDAGVLERQLYLVCEFMDGGSCADLHGVTAEGATLLSWQLLSGLQALHAARILHRDIKPANCLKRTDARIKLADLGLAMDVAASGDAARETAGTIPFMAPELFDNPPRYTPASDLYALGMTLACFVLEEMPFPRGTLREVMPWIRNGPRPRIGDYRPDLPPPLTALVTRMIAPQADVRPQTATQALGELTATMPAAPPADRDREEGEPSIGPWIVGDSVYSSSNWDGRAVTHYRTGAPGRLMHLKRDAPLAAATTMVLDAAERASQLDDAFVVPVLDWGLADDRVYVVTAPWGHTLLDLVRARGPFDEASALRFGRDLAQALASIHGRGLVYQNLDPGSAVISPDARSAYLSWPIYCVPAGESSARRILVPRYAAPEALNGSAATIETAVDMFGLGAVLLFLLTGLAPPRGEGAMVAFIRAQSPDVTAATASFVGELLDFAPERRPSADTALARLGALLARLTDR